MATCGLPSESYICTEVVNVSPAAAAALRFVWVRNCVVATGARSTPGGTVMSLSCPVVMMAPVVASVPV